MLHRILALGQDVLRGYDTRSLRIIVSGGAPLPGPVAVETMDTFGDVLYNFYGATETGIVTVANPSDLRASPWTIGKPVGGIDLRILSDDGEPVKFGEVGELFVASRGLVEGYHGDAKATKDSMRGELFSVGDLARSDEHGRFFIEGRKRDMIISGGVNVYPAEVEGVLESHPEVAEVAVVGVQDREWGERVRAFVVRKPDSSVTDADLKAYAKERLATPKVPREFIFLDTLPRNPTGKVLKKDLREWTPPTPSV
jgi:fatty-acyl-CoA synthase